MRWTVHGERMLYESDWVGLGLVDVEIPGGPRFDHHVIRMPREVSGTVVHDPDRGILLLWRHRFIADTWGWEVPAGGVESGETPAQAAIRETEEETGWRPDGVELLTAYYPSIGSSDQRFNVFLARDARQVGEPTDPAESERIEWVPVDRVLQLMQQGEVRGGLTMTAILYAVSFAGVRP
jgi:8-oxo-dGTP pyrophosphatase MutT (NUDIX family)